MTSGFESLPEHEATPLPTAEGDGIVDAYAGMNPASVRAVIQRYGEANAPVWLEKLDANVRYSYDVVLPRLYAQWSYEGEVPAADVERTCIKSPGSFEQKIEQWFAGAMTVLHRLREVGVSVEPTISQKLIRNHRKCSVYLDEVDGDNVEVTADDTKRARQILHAARQVLLSERGDRALNGGYAFNWDSLLLEYAVRKQLPTDSSLQDMDIAKAARYALTTTKKLMGEAGMMPDLDDWRVERNVAIAYLQSVRQLQARAVGNAYSVGYYRGREEVAALHGRYGSLDVPVRLINRAFHAHPRHVEKALDAIVDERTIIISEVESSGYTIDIDSASWLAVKRPLGDPIAKATSFLEAYIPLLDQWSDTAHFEFWMAARTIACERDHEMGVRHYIRLARAGVYEWMAVTMNTHKKKARFSEAPLSSIDILRFKHADHRDTADIASAEEASHEVIQQLSGRLNALELGALAIEFNLAYQPMTYEEVAAALGSMSFDLFVERTLERAREAE